MAEFLPLSDNVLVKVPEAAKETAGGILLPETATQDKPQYGNVLAAGPGRTLEDGSLVEMHVKAGDEVLFGAYAGIEVKINEQKLLVIRQDDILLKKVMPNDASDAGG